MGKFKPPLSLQPTRINIPLSYWSRHLKIGLKYVNLKKLMNLSLAYWHYLHGSPKIPTMPAFLKVEISRSCYVNCRYCLEEKAEVFYPFSNYKAIIDKLKDYILEVSLYDIGEPLNNKDVIGYIRYAHLQGVGTSISTSLSVKKSERFWKELVISGLDRIIVAIDGISERIYKEYRTGGNLNLVLSNLREIVKYRSMYKNSMFIEWQMIDLPWNKHEQGAARDLAEKIGCDNFRIIEEVTRGRSKYRQEVVLRRHNCLLPFIIFIVDAFNQVRTCYKIYQGNPPLGDLNHSTFEDIWNGDEIARIRDKNKIMMREYCRTCRE